MSGARADPAARPSAAEVVQAALVAAAERYAIHEPLIAAGHDWDAIRRARVGTRRLRSHLRTFAALVDPSWALPLRADLGALAAALGDVRDADVRLARYRGALEERREDDRAAGQALLRRCRLDRSEARARLLVRLKGDDHLRTRRRLATMIATPVWLATAAGDAEQVLPAYAVRPWRRLRRTVKALSPDADDDQLHTVRIATKRARYAVEAIVPVLGESGEQFGAALARLQTVLGTYHDAMISADWLRRSASQLPPAAAFVAGAVSAEEERVAQQARAAWPQAWSTLGRVRLPW
ncbi:MAG: hypothetical protein NVSMB29_17810 [Candidatus Dormibacteria bacterium]